jgi:hypothetical protein
MPFDLSLPIFAASALALGAALRYFGWPHIRMRIYNKTHGHLRVVEVAFILSHPARTRQAAGRHAPARTDQHPAGAEFVIYMTLKTGNL